MARQHILIGTVANDGTGEGIRSAFDKSNDNFIELYDDVAQLRTDFEGDDAADVNSVNGRNGNVTLDANDTLYSVFEISTDTTAVAGAVYVLTANLVLTLPSSPTVGHSVKISNLSQVDTCQVDGGAEKILGLSGALTLDNRYSSFEMVYSGANKGWVVIGQN